MIIQNLIIIAIAISYHVSYTAGKKPLVVAGMLPVTDNFVAIASRGYKVAAKMALEDVNSRSDVLNDYDLQIDFQDTKFFCPMAMKLLFEDIYKKPTKIAIFGPISSICCESVASVAPYWNLVQISNAATSATLSDKRLYPYFYRTAMSDVAYNIARRHLLHRFDWDKVATIYQPLSVFQASVDNLIDTLKDDNITIIAAEAVTDNPERQIELLKQKDARIILVYTYPEMAQKIMCAAYHLDYYGPNYVWMLLGWYFDNWWNKNITDHTNCTKEEMLTAIDGYLAVIGTQLGYSNQTTFSGLTPEQYIHEYIRYSPDHYLASVHSWSYDAVWALALALNNTDTILHQSGRSLLDFHYGDNYTRELIISSLENLSFLGVSGPVSFDHGERVSNIKIMQMQRHIAINNTVQIGLLTSSDDTLHLGSPYHDTFWRGNYIPKDEYIKRTVSVHISLYVFVPFLILSALGILLSLVFLSFNVSNRKLRYIKMSSPNLNNVILIGSVLCYLSVIAFGLESFNAVCRARVWLLALGFTLSFGSLFSKTWRVHRIYTNKYKMRVAIRDPHLFLMIFVFVLIDVIIILVWEFVDPMEATNITMSKHVDPIETDYLIISKYLVCYCHHITVWLGIIYGYKFLLLIFGAFLAWETRKVTLPALNDSKFIGLSIYNVVVLCIVGVLINTFVANQIDVSFALIASFIIFCTTLMKCFVFVPKIRNYRTDPEASKNNLVMKTIGNMASAILSDYSMPTRETVKELKKQIEDKDKTIEKLNKIVKRYAPKDMDLQSEMMKVSFLTTGIMPPSRLSVDFIWPKENGDNNEFGNQLVLR